MRKSQPKYASLSRDAQCFARIFFSSFILLPVLSHTIFIHGVAYRASTQSIRTCDHMVKSDVYWCCTSYLRNISVCAFLLLASSQLSSEYQSIVPPVSYPAPIWKPNNLACPDILVRPRKRKGGFASRILRTDRALHAAHLSPSPSTTTTPAGQEQLLCLL